MDRPYKTDSEEETITRINGILEDLDVTPHCESRENIGDALFSCRYSLNGLAEFAQNGKGTSEARSTASALAELMERIQNFAIFMMKLGIDGMDILRSLPDMQPIDSIASLGGLEDGPSRADMESILRELPVSENSPTHAARFYDVKNDCVAILPYHAILLSTGSNGMCAGNNPAEAISQGICEVLEREVLKQLYAGKMVPPIVPAAFLKEQAAYKIIQTLDRRGISIIVNDCSMGRGFPVVSAIGVHRATGRYRFAIGSHTVFGYALERALTELFQGYGESDVARRSKPLILGEDPFAGPGGSKECDLARSKELASQFKGKGGKIPPTLLHETPSHEFTPWNFFRSSTSYEEDLRHLKNFVIENGSNLFIKDLSFLGFPTYFVYVPGYSSLMLNLPWKTSGAFEDFVALHERQGRTLREIYQDSDGGTPEELRDLAAYIEAYCNCAEIPPTDKPRGWLESLLHATPAGKQAFPPEYVLASLYFRLGDHGRSLSSMDRLLSTYHYERERDACLFALRDGLLLRNQGHELGQVKSLLRTYYPRDSASVAVSLLTNDGNGARPWTPPFSENVVSDKGRSIFGRVRHRALASSLDSLALRQWFL